MTDRPKAIVIGGSVGGLFAASLLRAAGWEATIYERSRGDLAGRGAGVGVTRELMDAIRRVGATFDPSIGEPHNSSIWLEADESIRFEYRKSTAASAWARIYRPLRAAYPDEHYRAGMVLERVEQRADSVTAAFADGSRAEGDLLVAADGNLSTVRNQFLPDVAPRYAGYVAWRGIVEQTDLPAATRKIVEGHIVFSFHEGEMLLTLAVPAGDEGESDRRRVYFIWYRPTESESALRDLFTDAEGRFHGVSIPPPLIRPELIDGVKARAMEIFAPSVAQAVWRTPQPLLQAISDLESPQLAFGRVALMGDAAFVARPHVAGGITKAALDAIELVAALGEGSGDIASALALYGRKQRDLGSALVAHARALGGYVEKRGGADAPDPKWIMRNYGAPHLLHAADPKALSAS